jgi:hypothetical protein
MKREQRSEQMNARWAKLAAARAQLERGQARSAGEAVLSRLEGLLSEHSAALKSFRDAATRLEEMARRYTEKESICLPGDLNAIAKDLIAGDDLTKVISAARLPLEKGLYSGMHLPEPDDIGIIKKIDFERAATQALKRAIELQKTVMAAERRRAICEFSRSAGDVRATFARELLAAFKNLNELAERDRGLAQQLEASEIQFLRPKPFPIRMLSAEAREWLLECVSEGLIEAPEVAGVGLA